MRLFLYLLALVAGFSPAQATSAALFEPAAIGAVSPAAAQKRAAQVALAPHHAHLRPGIMAIERGAAAIFPQYQAAAPIFLTDRPRT